MTRKLTIYPRNEFKTFFGLFGFALVEESDRRIYPHGYHNETTEKTNSIGEMKKCLGVLADVFNVDAKDGPR